MELCSPFLILSTSSVFSYSKFLSRVVVFLWLSVYSSRFLRDSLIFYLSSSFSMRRSWFFRFKDTFSSLIRASFWVEDSIFSEEKLLFFCFKQSWHSLKPYTAKEERHFSHYFYFSSFWNLYENNCFYPTIFSGLFIELLLFSLTSSLPFFSSSFPLSLA